MSKRKVLVIGSGGREHTLAWKLAQSPQVSQVLVAPGNGGTAAADDSIIANADIAATDIDRLLAFALERAIDLTVVGPEMPLEAGIVDRFQAAGLRCFGPTQAAARLETSKAFAKDFMRRQGIPTADFATFDQYEAALEYVRAADRPLAIKASGLAAGKGVIVCDDRAQAEQALFDILRARVFGKAGDQVIVEERISGPEVSLLAFSDGATVVPMPSAQDHKRVLDDDQGPNTGGMGAYAPVRFFTPERVEEAVRTVLQPAVLGLAAQGTPYVGVLYAGLMLTSDGLRVLEFNCRFGDPETQVILPLMETDLVEVIEACLDGRLSQCEVRWKAGAAATIVAAAPGYPGAYPKGAPIRGVDQANALSGVQVFHAGTKRRGQELVTDGGRVLAVTGIGADLPQALQRAYQGIAQIQFEGMHYRKDIGAKA